MHAARGLKFDHAVFLCRSGYTSDKTDKSVWLSALTRATKSARLVTYGHRTSSEILSVLH